jgi:hypothetical protein
MDFSAGTPELTADVSLAARAFFEHSGFEVVREQRPTKDGIELINYRMRKDLSYPSARKTTARRAWPGVAKARTSCAPTPGTM